MTLLLLELKWHRNWKVNRILKVLLLGQFFSHQLINLTLYVIIVVLLSSTNVIMHLVFNLCLKPQDLLARAHRKYDLQFAAGRIGLEVENLLRLFIVISDQGLRIM